MGAKDQLTTYPYLSLYLSLYLPLLLSGICFPRHFPSFIDATSWVVSQVFALGSRSRERLNKGRKYNWRSGALARSGIYRPVETGEIDGYVQTRRVSLRLPDHFGEAFHHLVHSRVLFARFAQ